jgi:hypothetical protein
MSVADPRLSGVATQPLEGHVYTGSAVCVPSIAVSTAVPAATPIPA